MAGNFVTNGTGPQAFLAVPPLLRYRAEFHSQPNPWQRSRSSPVYSVRKSITRMSIFQKCSRWSLSPCQGLVDRGMKRDRYHSASELQSYSGIAPVLASSRKQSWVHWRWACPQFVRQTFHEWAAHSIGSSAWAKSYYQQQRAKGKPRNTVIRALAFKWIRILFRCWKDGQPYCEDRYLRALAHRKQLAGHGSPVQFEWKTCAGFDKISAITS